MRAAHPAVLALPAAQGKDGESPDRQRRADTWARTAVPHAVRLRPAGRAGVATAVSGATGEGEAGQGQSPGCLRPPQQPPPPRGREGTSPGGGREGRPTRGRSLGVGVVRATPGARSRGHMGQKTQAAHPAALGLARGQTWHRKSGQPDAHRPRRGFPEPGPNPALGGGPKARSAMRIQKPRALGGRHRRRPCFDHLVGIQTT